MLFQGSTQAAAIGLAALALAAAAPALAQQQDYRNYRNARFGVSVDVPRDWRAGRQPENGDGLTFTSPDGASKLMVFGSLNIADTIAEALETELAVDDGETVTYRNKGERSVTISGLRGGTIFYRKSILSCADQVVSHVSIEYPAARKAAFDALVSHIAGSLRGGPGEQVSSCQ